MRSLTVVLLAVVIAAGRGGTNVPKGRRPRKWKWIIPSWRYRDDKADKCPTDAGSARPPSAS